MRTLIQCLALAIIAGFALMAALQRAEPPRRLPLVHAAFPICQAPQEGNESGSPGASQGEPQAPPQEPSLGPDQPNIA